MKPLYILKIGGSVATYKNSRVFKIREKEIARIGKEIKKAQSQKRFNLILVHGAGSFGHQLAHKYNIAQGVKTKKQIAVCHEIKMQCAELNLRITQLLLKQGIRVFPLQTSAVFVNKSKKAYKCNSDIVAQALDQGAIPVLYGDMVFDEAEHFSICSGDVICSHLAKKLGATKVLFASDVDGIFNKDPYEHNDAILLKTLRPKDFHALFNNSLGKSHSVDVTGGMKGKIQELATVPKLKEIIIYNGLKPHATKRNLLGMFTGTVIKK